MKTSAAPNSKKASQLIKTELLISIVLRYGVILCSAVITIGLLGRIFHLGSIAESSREIISSLLKSQELSGSPPHTPSEFWSGVIQFTPDTVMALGLILLISLPILRVGMTVLLFLFEKDWAFLFITLIVFSVLIFGIIFGQAL